MNNSDLLIKDFYRLFPLFNNLEKTEKRKLAASLYFDEIPAGVIYVNEGRNCSGLTFVLSGQINAYKLSENGREVVLYKMPQGEICLLTASCLLDQSIRFSPISVKAEIDATVAVLPANFFSYLYYSNPILQRYLLSSLLAKFYEVLGLLTDITFKKVDERLWELLVRRTHNGSQPLYMTQADIAHELGTAREVVSRILKKLAEQGRVTLNRGKILVSFPQD